AIAGHTVGFCEPPPWVEPSTQMLCQCERNTRPPMSAYVFKAFIAFCDLVSGCWPPSHDRITMSYFDKPPTVFHMVCESASMRVPPPKPVWNRSAPRPDPELVSA